MTQAIRVHQVGGPDVMVLETVDIAMPGPGEVLVEHQAIGINYLDVYFRSGAYPSPTGLPFTPGSEGAGIVLAVGPDVTAFQPGDRVAYVATPGSYAQQRLVPAHFLVKLPPDISFETAAAMMLKGMTAEYLLHRTYAVHPGDVILVHAAAGGVGLILCQWGRALGAIVIGTVGSPEKAALAQANGAHHTILYRTEDVAARVREITGGAGAHVAYDGVGRDTFMASLDSLRPLGVFVSYGAASGSIDAFNIGLLAQKGSLYATRPTLFTHMATQNGVASMSQNLITAVTTGVVKVPISQSFALKDAAEAHRALEARATVGSMILIP